MKNTFLFLVLIISLTSCKKVVRVTDIKCQDPFQLCAVKVQDENSLGQPSGTSYTEYRTFIWIKNNSVSVGDELHPIANFSTKTRPGQFTATCVGYNELYTDEDSLVYEVVCSPKLDWIDYIPYQRFISQSRPHLGEEYNFKAYEWVPGGFVSKYKKE